MQEGFAPQKLHCRGKFPLVKVADEPDSAARHLLSLDFLFKADQAVSRFFRISRCA
jgi:hypothetical protein